MKTKHDPSKSTIVCRCQDVSLDDVEAAIDAGITHPEELKRFLHIGMGPCQGRTCGSLVLSILSRKTGQPIAEFVPLRLRPPLVPVPLHHILGEDDD